jgi:glycosyltransferase EpsJ
MKPLTPYVSIIVPVYNNEKYLRECLNSLINQELKEIEIILINDGSTDRSPDIIKKYALKDPRIKIINQDNRGPNTARNKGIKVSKGEYIGFVDSDDTISKDMYKKMYNTAKEHNADIVTSGYHTCDENLNIISTHYPLFRYNVIFSKEDKIKMIEEIYKNKFSFFAVRNLYKKEMILEKNYFFDEDIRIGTELLFNFFYFYNANRIIALKEAFYFYRASPTSITRSRYKPHLEKSLQLQHEKMVQFYKEYGIFEKYSIGFYKRIAETFPPMLLTNMFAKDNVKSASFKELRRILNLPMIKESLKHTPLINKGLPTGKQIIIILSKLKLYRLLWLYYKVKR